MDKALCRRLMLARRTRLTSEEVNLFSPKILQNLYGLLDHLHLHKPLVGTYLAQRGEVDLQGFAYPHASLCLPKVVAKGYPLVFYTYNSQLAIPKEYNRVFRNLREYLPAADAVPVYPQVVLVPLVAYNAQRQRLGMGQGFYDRTLEVLRQRPERIIAIGIAYGWQEVVELDTEPHDQTLDYIVNERQII